MAVYLGYAPDYILQQMLKVSSSSNNNNIGTKQEILKMSIPTYYGPAAVYNDTTNDQTVGTISQLILQPTAGAVTANKDDITYKETWIGPYQIIKNLPMGDYQGYKGFVVGNKRPDLTGNKYVVRFDVPNPPTGKYWLINDVSIDENTEGDLGTINITYQLTFETTTSEEGTDQLSQKGETTWNMSWNELQVTPYDYVTDDDVAEFHWKIESCLQEEKSQRSRTGNKENYYFDPVDQYARELTENQKKVKNKIVKGVQPIIFTPVLTRTRVFEGTSQKIFDVTQKLEFSNYQGYVVDLPDDCPFINEKSNQNYLYAGAKVTMTSKSFSEEEVNDDDTTTVTKIYQNYTIEEQFIGIGENYDKDFYSQTDHWVIGNLKSN